MLTPLSTSSSSSVTILKPSTTVVPLLFCLSLFTLLDSTIATLFRLWIHLAFVHFVTSLLRFQHQHQHNRKTLLSNVAEVCPSQKVVGHESMCVSPYEGKKSRLLHNTNVLLKCTLLLAFVRNNRNHLKPSSSRLIQKSINQRPIRFKVRKTAYERCELEETLQSLLCLSTSLC